MQPIRDVIIIGAGPAGYTAAIYAARANLNPLVFEGTQYGGALMRTTMVENFPGFAEGIQGPELMETLRKQAQHFGAELITTDITALDLAAGSRPSPPMATATGPERSFSRWVRLIGLWACPMKSACPAGACPGARPVTDSSSGSRTSPWSAAVTPRSRKRFF